MRPSRKKRIENPQIIGDFIKAVDMLAALQRNRIFEQFIQNRRSQFDLCFREARRLASYIRVGVHPRPGETEEQRETRHVWRHQVRWEEDEEGHPRYGHLTTLQYAKYYPNHVGQFILDRIHGECELLSFLDGFYNFANAFADTFPQREMEVVLSKVDRIVAATDQIEQWARWLLQQIPWNRRQGLGVEPFPFVLSEREVDRRRSPVPLRPESREYYLRTIPTDISRYSHEWQFDPVMEVIFTTLGARSEEEAQEAIDELKTILGFENFGSDDPMHFAAIYIADLEDLERLRQAILREGRPSGDVEVPGLASFIDPVLHVYGAAGGVDLGGPQRVYPFEQWEEAIRDLTVRIHRPLPEPGESPVPWTHPARGSRPYRVPEERTFDPYEAYVIVRVSIDDSRDPEEVSPSRRRERQWQEAFHPLEEAVEVPFDPAIRGQIYQVLEWATPPQYGTLTPVFDLGEFSFVLYAPSQLSYLNDEIRRRMTEGWRISMTDDISFWGFVIDTFEIPDVPDRVAYNYDQWNDVAAKWDALIGEE